MGSPKIFNFWGEEKWRQAKLAMRVSSCKPISTRDCGDYDDDGMSGFDSYEDNDF